MKHKTYGMYKKNFVYLLFLFISVFNYNKKTLSFSKTSLLTPRLDGNFHHYQVKQM